ncbi:MAG: DUF1302 family protein [Fidelibacterota bacterium]
MKRSLILAAMLCACLNFLWAEIEYHGLFRHHSAFRTTEPYNALVLRNRLRLNSELWNGDVYGFASVDFLNDAVVDNTTELNLREAYLDVYSSWVDFRIGKQQVVWGKADGYFINDIVNPLDLSLFLLQDFDDIRTATTMLNTRFHHGNQSLELLVIPEFRPMNIDYRGNWAFRRPDSVAIPHPEASMRQMMNIPMVYLESSLPEYSVKNFEYGLKLNMFLLGTDISLIYFKAREDQPVMQKEIVTDPSSSHDEIEMQVTPTHPWFTFYGLNFSRPMGMWVIRGEGGYYPKRWYDTMDFTAQADGLLVKKPFFQGMVGVEYQLTADLNVAAQAIQERILDYEEALLKDEVINLGTLLLKGSFRNETILPMWLVLYNFSNDSYLSRISLDWKFADSFTITFGADILGGGADTIFGQFDQNDNLYLKLRYDF